MQNFLYRIRQKSEKERKVIALSASGVLVGIIFLVWITSLISRVESGAPEKFAIQEQVIEQKASVIESVKRKAELLFGENSPISEGEFDLFSKTIEYKKEEKEEDVTEANKELNELLEAFNATSSEEEIGEIGVDESEI